MASRGKCRKALGGCEAAAAATASISRQEGRQFTALNLADAAQTAVAAADAAALLRY